MTAEKMRPAPEAPPGTDKEAPSGAGALEGILDPVREEVEATGRLVATILRSEDPAVQRLVGHVSRYSGKLIRPAVLHLAASGCAGPDPAADSAPDATKRLRAAAAVDEMIHMTSLVHDDVLDEAPLRRWQATANAAWGNHSAIILGDYIFSRAMETLVAIGDLRVLDRFARAAKVICEGELAQSCRRYALTLTEEDYFSIIGRKTGELFAAAAWLGATLAGAPPESAARLERYGRSLGVAFQIADACLDLLGEEALAGKSLGTDLTRGCLTRPMIRWLSARPPARREEALAELRVDGEWGDRRLCASRLLETGAVEYSTERARASASAAAEELDGLGDSECLESLRRLAEHVVTRWS